MTLVKNQIVSLKKSMKQKKKEYLSSFSSKQLLKQEKKNEINEMIKSMSTNLLLTTEKKQGYQEFIQTVKSKIDVFDETQTTKQDYLKILAISNEQILKIKKVIKRSGLKELKTLNKEGVDLIIESFHQLMYQESSLESKFSMLTAECQEKKKEYERFEKKINKLREENQMVYFNPTLNSTTFNQLKGSIDEQQMVYNKSEEAGKIEEQILTVYLEVLNIATSAMKFMGRVTEYAEEMDFDLKNYLKETGASLDHLKRGFFSKREIVQLKSFQMSRKKLQKSIDFSDINPEYFNKEILPYFSLTHSEITYAFSKFFDSASDSEKFANFIKKSPIIYSFITPSILSSYLSENSSIEGVFHNVVKLLRIGHKELQAQYLKLVNLAQDIVLQVKEQREKEILEFQNNYPEYDPENPEYFNKRLKVPKRRTFRVPTVIKDRVKMSVKTEEETKDLKFKNFDLSIKANDHNFGQTMENSGFKTARIEALETPQAVLKEIQSIEEKIKSIRYKERLAEMKTLNSQPLTTKNNKQPWTHRLIRPKTQEKGLRNKLSIQFLSPSIKTRKNQRIDY